MKVSQSLTRSLALSCWRSMIVAGAALAEKFEPRVGQPGKDVVWVPSPQALVDRMMDLAEVGPGKVHFDLGSGDGRTVITAAKRGATAFGVEFNPNMVEPRARKRQGRRRDRTRHLHRGRPVPGRHLQGHRRSRCSCCRTSICGCARSCWTCSPAPASCRTRSTWATGSPEQTIQAGAECTSWCRAHLWIVPAKVAGTWKLPDGGELTLEQKYQMISGTLHIGNSNMTIYRRQGDRRSDHVHRRQHALHRPCQRKRHRRHRPDLDRLARNALTAPKSQINGGGRTRSCRSLIGGTHGSHIHWRKV